MVTLTRIGDKLFNLAFVQEVNLQYDRKRHDTRSTQVDAGVEIILASGARLGAYFGPDADLLRDYFEGRPVPYTVIPLGQDARVVYLQRPAADEGTETLADQVAGDARLSTAWGVIEPS